jgi:rod shape determining protein RodA
MIGVMLIPPRLLHLFSYPLYGVSLLLLVAVPFFGRTVAGAASWFEFGAVKFQPSEFGKIATVLALANFLSHHRTDARQVKDFLIATLFVLVPVGLIMKQPDFGTATVFLAFLLPILYWAGASPFVLFVIISMCVVAVVAIWGTVPLLIALAVIALCLYFLQENKILSFMVMVMNTGIGLMVQFVLTRIPVYQQKRIATFLNPEADPLGAGYNAMQAQVAVGSGGFLGKGFLHGTQTQLKFIPKQWTDFIFCVPGEEFGFVGAMVVLLLFAFLLFRGVNLAAAVKNKFLSLIAIGITTIWLYHIFINVGMTLGLLPVMGIWLPFLSYGGSALLSNMIMVGLLLNIYAHRKEY